MLCSVFNFYKLGRYSSVYNYSIYSSRAASFATEVGVDLRISVGERTLGTDGSSRGLEAVNALAEEG